VSIDNAFGIERAVEHLADCGHKLISFISDSIVTLQRLEAYKAALPEFNIPVYDEYIRIGRERYERGGYLRMKELLNTNPKPTAVFAVTDTMAIGAIHAIKEAGLSVPDDISVVGFDDIAVSSYLEKPLTTVLQPKFEIGRTASKLLLDKIDNKEHAFSQQIVIKPELIIRDTVKIQK
jgi:DNA-binding LacI/PurR family transcriptional regulator